mgnify:FL=1
MDVSARTEPKIVVLLDEAPNTEALVRRLLDESGARVVLADRDPRRAQALVERSGEDAGRLEVVEVDPRRAESVARAADGADWLVVTPGAGAEPDPIIAGALEAGVHCLDLSRDPRRASRWSAHREQFTAAGRVVLADASARSGLPGLLLEAVTTDRPWAFKVDVATVVRPPTTAHGVPAEMEQVVDEFTAQPRIFAFGHPTRDLGSYIFPYRYHWFGAPFRRQSVAFTTTPGVESFAARHPKIYRIRAMVGGLGARALYVLMPVLYPFVFLFRRATRGPVAKVLYHLGVRGDANVPGGIVVRADVTDGEQRRGSVEIQHEQPETFDVDVAVAALRGFERDHPEPGVHLLCEVFEPRSFLEDLEQMGARLHRSESARGPKRSDPAKA